VKSEANAVQVAQNIQQSLDDPPGKKTIAGVKTGDRTISGWKQQPGFIQATERVMIRCEEIGYSLRPAGPLDKGVPGRYNASHAEKQISVIYPDQPIGVSSEMCLDCQEYFKALVRHTGNIQVIADPKIVRIFHPNGNVDELSNVSNI